MKHKKLFGVITFAAIATVAGWNYNQNKQNVVLSDLALANIEALARWEDPNEARGFEKKYCKDSYGTVYAARCCRSASSTSICHYNNDLWGKNCDCEKAK